MGTDELEELRLRNTELRLLVMVQDSMILQFKREIVDLQNCAADWKQVAIAAISKNQQMEQRK